MATLTINCSPLVLSLSNIHTRKEGEKSAQKENAKALGHPVAIATQEQTAPPVQRVCLLIAGRLQLTTRTTKNRSELY